VRVDELIAPLRAGLLKHAALSSVKPSKLHPVRKPKNQRGVDVFLLPTSELPDCYFYLCCTLDA